MVKQPLRLDYWVNVGVSALRLGTNAREKTSSPHLEMLAICIFSRAESSLKRVDNIIVCTTRGHGLTSCRTTESVLDVSASSSERDYQE